MLPYLSAKGKQLLQEFTKERTTREQMFSQGKARSMSYRSQPSSISCLNEDLQVRLDTLGNEGKRSLLKDVSKLHSFNVCEIINSVETVTDDTITERL